MTEKYTALQRYGIAAFTVAIALVLTCVLQPLLSHTPALLFFLAIVLTTWYSGTGSGFWAASLSALAFEFVGSVPRWQLMVDEADLLRWGAWIATVVATNSLHYTLWVAKRQAYVRGLKLWESREQLSLAIETAEMGTWDWDIQTGKVSWSKQHELLFGLPPDTFAGTVSAFLACLHPIDRDRVAQSLEAVQKSRSDYSQEFRVLWLDGTVHWIVSRGRFLPNEMRQPIRMLGTVLDVTERKQAEEVLRQSHEQLEKLVEERTLALTQANVILQQEIAERQQAQEALYRREQESKALLDNTPDIIIRCDRAFRYVYVNPALERITGLPAAFFLGRTSQEQGLPESLCQTWDTTMQRMFDTGQEQTVEFETTSRPGCRSYQSRVVPELDAEGNVQYALIVSRDVTALKQAELERWKLIQEQTARAEAEAANRMKDEFLATLSHELRTPLNSILGWSRLLNSRPMSAAKTTQALETIERNAKLQAQLIEDILDVSRIIRGKLRLNLCPIHLTTIIQAAIDAVRPAAEAKSLQLTCRCASPLERVWVDPERIQQVVWNLLSNAVKFTPPGGRVEAQMRLVESPPTSRHILQAGFSHGILDPLKVDDLDSQDTEHLDIDHLDAHDLDLATAPITDLEAGIEIQIRDTGIGIASEFLPHVFERFRQADSTTTRSQGGLGLGLAIVRHLVELHGGTVQATSPGEGRGSTFIVRLPLVKRPATHQSVRSEKFRAPAPDVGLTLKGIQVLLVDDELDIRELFTVVLEAQGAKVIAVASVDEALNALHHCQPDILLSDIAMPEQDGYKFIQQVRANSKIGSIPAIALTAYARPEDQQRSLAAGFQMHLSKPVEPEALSTAIATLVESSRSIRSLS